MELWIEPLPVRPTATKIVPSTVKIPSTADPECQQMVTEVVVRLNGTTTRG